ncbi:MAG: hypothetical protein JWO60_1510 [Frankiales bacterium]|nr:hypothetical protein [Frankiales bacterium]
MRAPLPLDEAQRLRALRRLAVLDTADDPTLDRVAGLAASLTGAPVGLVSLVDEDRQWTKAAHGCTHREVSRDVSFCAWTILDRDVLTVPDARQDARFADNPVVVAEPFAVRAYAGAPLVTSDGYAVGALCVVDPEARTFTVPQQRGLTDLAALVVEALEARELRMHYRSVCDAVGVVTFHADGLGRLLALSEPWEELTGLPVMQSLGLPLLDLVVPALRESTRQRLLFGRRGADGLVRVETRLALARGREVPVELTATLVRGSAGRTAGLVGTVTDITERQDALLEQSHNAKLEALGRLAAGLAHEINTPIQFVGDNTRFLSSAYEDLLALVRTYQGLMNAESGSLSWQERSDAAGRAEAEADLEYLSEEVPAAVQQTLEGVDRVASIVQSMKAFSYKDTSSSRADLNEALRSTVTVATNETKYVADVELDLGELPLVDCHVGDLSQVFLNLLVNAADALGTAGRRGRIQVRSRAEGGEVVLTFQDDGPGVPADIREKVFEPFFTTKQVGRGTGQGLALARSIVRDRHDGTLTLTEAPGGGALFEIRLPVHGVRAGAA